MTSLSGVLRFGAVVTIAFSVAACEMTSLLRPPGSREWIITVVNGSNRPAVLAVAADTSPMGDLVGSAMPASVPPHGTMDVVFTVPPGDGWAIFVNPGPNLGALIMANDVPAGMAGKLPLTISIGGDGSPSVSVPGEPGWFGN